MMLLRTNANSIGGLHWSRDGTVPSLDDAEVHLWLVRSDVPCDPPGDRVVMLDSQELRRAASLRSETARARFLRRRLALRMILGRYLETPPADIEYRFNAYGKPSVRAKRADRSIVFSVSSSSDTSLIAVARCLRIGVDLERLAPIADADSIAGRYFTPNEAAALAGLPEHDRTCGFYAAWTRKEAVVKALGKGLSIPLDTFEISVSPDEPPRILGCAFDPTLGETLHLMHLSFCAGYVGALACAPAPTAVRHGAFSLSKALSYA